MATPTKSSSLSRKAQAVMQACRARTGFDSYHAYLYFHGENNSALKNLCRTLRPLEGMAAEKLDTDRELKQEGSLVLNISKDWQVSVDDLHRDEKGTDIIEAVCHPPEDAQLQIIMWDKGYYLSRENMSQRCSPDYKSRESLADLLGLHFGLDPLLFKAIDAIGNGDKYKNMYLLDRYKPSHATERDCIATVCNSRDSSNDIPVMLIAGEYFPDTVDQFAPCPPFYRSQLDSVQDIKPDKRYPQALHHLLRRYHTTQADFNDLLFLCCLPPLQDRINDIRIWCGKMRHTLDLSEREASNYTGLDKRQLLLAARARVRRSMIEMEDDWANILRYMRFRFRWNPSRSAIYQDFEDEVKTTVHEASRWESEVRDDLQLTVGNLSLEESKKSIELSSQQIEEAKRVKIFTILAFIYVPLTLATSIYGMNLQQLNGTGQTVREFLVTALVALIITGGTWSVTEPVNAYRDWNRRRAAVARYGDEPGPKYSLVERAAMIMWLLRNHHGAWMMRTRVWWMIATNSKRNMQASDDSWVGPAGDLVSLYSLGELHAFHLEVFSLYPD